MRKTKLKLRDAKHCSCWQCKLMENASATLKGYFCHQEELLDSGLTDHIIYNCSVKHKTAVNLQHIGNTPPPTPEVFPMASYPRPQFLNPQCTKTSGICHTFKDQSCSSTSIMYTCSPFSFQFTWLQPHCWTCTAIESTASQIGISS